MDCRNLGILFLGLLPVVVGCVPSTQGTRLLPVRGAERDPDDLVHKAPTYVAFGDFRVTSANAPEVPPDMVARLREEARLSYLKAIEVDPKYVPAYEALAKLSSQLGDHVSCQSTLMKAIEIDGKADRLWHDLSLCQSRQKKWTDAVSSIQTAVQLAPQNRSYQALLGYTQARAGLYQDSLATLTKVHGEAKAHFELARMLSHLQQTDNARQFAQFALAKDPNLPGVQTFLNQLDGKKSDQKIHQASYQSSPSPETPPKDTPTPAVQPTITVPVNPQSRSEASSPIREGGLGAVSGKIDNGTELGKPVKLPTPPVIRSRSY